MIARAVAVPGDALLRVYADSDGAYTDCFEVMHPLQADLPAFVTAFYTTWIFRLERFVLSLMLRRRIRDSEVVALAEAAADRFAIWEVEARQDGQILLCAKGGQTRSWLAVAAKEGGVTRLLFGSAVIGHAAERPFWVKALTPAHVFYSRLLLRAAERKLRRG
jgi:hypothetical protein